MGSEYFDIDPELLAEFIDESIDSLAPLENTILELEFDPDNVDVVNKVFRPVHSLKGNASFFGLLKAKELSHKLETLLDLIRSRKMVASKEVVACILPGLDMLQSILANVRAGKPEVEDEDEFHEILNPIEQAAHEEKFDITRVLEKVRATLTTLSANLPQESVADVDFCLKLINETLSGSKAEADPNAGLILPQPLRHIFELLKDPITEPLEEESAKQVEAALRTLAGMASDAETKLVVGSALDEYDTFVNQIGFDPLLRDLILEKAATLRESGKWLDQDVHAKSEAEAAPPPEEPAAPPAKAETTAATPAAETAEAEKTMRVSEKRIDDFLSFVGELVVVEEMFHFLQTRLVISLSANKGLVHDYKRVLETFSALSDNLRKSILTIRKVPVRTILQKAPRIIHDIAAKTGKEVDIILEGEQINIDKSYMDILDAPLTHMVRNAIDHGIETPDVREAAGKPRKGTITIAVRELENVIELSAVDDGKGIDYAALQRKAVEIGLIDAKRELNHEQVVALLFESGVSTAKEITDISGRGVGMDVVKRNIDSMGGKIFVESQSGKGSSFRISLPLNISTQIMDGFLIQTGKEIYVLPMDKISESFAPMPNEISTIAGKGEMVSRHGKMIPVIRLHHALGLTEDIKENIMVSVDAKGMLLALYVDNILGVQKVVVKNIEGLEVTTDIFHGSAIMGNGSVAMIIDPEKLHRLSEG